jgi:hypothetical protein
MWQVMPEGPVLFRQGTPGRENSVRKLNGAAVAATMPSDA